MEKLVMHTGGSFVLTVLTLLLEIIALVISLISLFVKIKKHCGIEKTQKVEYAVLIVSMIIISMVIGGTMGYYLCMDAMLPS